MLTDLRSINTSSSSATISPKFSTVVVGTDGEKELSLGGGNALKRFRMYSPPPLPTRLPTPPAPPKTLQDFPYLTATNQDPLLVRALVSVTDEETGNNDLTFQVGQEIKVTTLTPHWAWGQYECDGVLHAGVFSKHFVQVVEAETPASSSSSEEEETKPVERQEEEEDYLKDLEACYMSVEDDGFRL